MSKISINHVNVLDIREGVWLTDHTVLIENDQISRVEPMPAETLTADHHVDGYGQFLIPGLIEMHGHFYGRAVKVMASQHAGYCPLYLSGGVTTVRTPGEFEPELTWQWKRDIEAGTRVGPRIISGGSYFERTPSIVFWFKPSASLEEIRAVFPERSAYSDFYKVYSNMPPGWVKVVCDLGHADGKKVYGHLGMCPTIDAIEAGLDGVEHGFFTVAEFYKQPSPTIDEESLLMLDTESDLVKRVIDTIVSHQTTITPTNMTFTLLGKDYTNWLEEHGAFRYLSPEGAESHKARRVEWDSSDEKIETQKRLLEKQFRYVNKLHRAGARLFCGTDPSYPMILPGAALHVEARLMQACGLSNIELMRSLTIAAANELNIGALTGAIEPGKQADLVLLDGDPLADIAALEKVQTVWKGGRQFDPKQLEQTAVGQIR